MFLEVIEMSKALIAVMTSIRVFTKTNHHLLLEMAGLVKLLSH